MKKETLDRANELIDNINFCKNSLKDISSIICYYSFDKITKDDYHIKITKVDKSMPNSLKYDFAEFLKSKQKEYEKELEGL